MKNAGLRAAGATRRMSNNIFECIPALCPSGASENRVATVEMSFRIIARHWKCHCRRDYIPRDEQTRRLRTVAGIEGSNARAAPCLRCLMISQCAPGARTNLFRVWCIAHDSRIANANPFSSLGDAGILKDVGALSEMAIVKSLYSGARDLQSYLSISAKRKRGHIVTSALSKCPCAPSPLPLPLSIQADTVKSPAIVSRIPAHR